MANYISAHFMPSFYESWQESGLTQNMFGFVEWLSELILKVANYHGITFANQFNLLLLVDVSHYSGKIQHNSLTQHHA